MKKRNTKPKRKFGSKKLKLTPEQGRALAKLMAEKAVAKRAAQEPAA